MLGTYPARSHRMNNSSTAVNDGSHLPCSFTGGYCSDFAVMCIRIVQASYSQPEGGIFFIGMFTACSVMLQILKSKLAYFYIIVKIILRTRRRLDCSVKTDRSKNSSLPVNCSYSILPFPA
jgi:hypothetical protein